MPKHTFKVSSSAADAELENNFYQGDTPPAGTYRVVLKKLRIRETKSGSNEMLVALYEINEPKGPKSAYNGYAIWENMNVTDESAAFVNRFLDAFGFNRKVFWAQGVVTDNENPPNVTKIGTKLVDTVQPIVVTTKMDYYNPDDPKLRISGYSTKKAGLPTDEEDAAADAEADETEGIALGDEEEGVEADQDGIDIYTEEDLAEFEIDDLRAILDYYEVKYTKAAKAPSLIASILEAQEAAGDGEGEEETSEEEESDGEGEGDTEAEGDESEGYSEDDLNEFDIDDLKGILDEWEVEYPNFPAKTAKAKLIALILETQGGEGEEEAEEEAEEEEASEAYDEDGLMAMDLAAIKSIAVDEFGIDLPKPPLKAKIVKLILLEQEKASSEPPF